MYEAQPLPIRNSISESHRAAINSFTQSGTWYAGSTRLQILKEFRHANLKQCKLCKAQKAALSPYSVKGEHDKVTDLDEPIIEIIHRITSDSGRLTERWFTALTQDRLRAEEYIEVLGCLATALVLDTFAAGIGLDPLEPETPVSDSVPGRITNPDVVKEAAWVPVSKREYELGPSGLPTLPNIVRAMGLVPDAIMQFFPVMRAHYGLSELDSDLTRSQTELIAARTSSFNDCFY